MSHDKATRPANPVQWSDDGTVAVLCQTSEAAVRRWRWRRRIYAIAAIVGLAVVILRWSILRATPESAEDRAFDLLLVPAAAMAAILCALAWLMLCHGVGRRPLCFLRIDRQRETIAGAWGSQSNAEQRLWALACLGFFGAMLAGALLTDPVGWIFALLGLLLFSVAAYFEGMRRRNPRTKTFTTPEGTSWMEMPLDAFTHLVWITDADFSGERHYHLVGIRADGAVQEILSGAYATYLHPYRKEVSEVLGRCTGKPIWETIEGAHTVAEVWELRERGDGQALLARWCRPLDGHDGRP